MFANLFKRFIRRLGALTAISASETGLRRPDNQDSVYVNAAEGVFAVADGMGGGSEGGTASRMVCNHLAASNWEDLDLSERLAVATGALRAAHAEIREYAGEHGFAHMGTTAVVLLFDPEDLNRAAIAYAGDSRVYRIRRGRAETLTRDHTVGRELGLYGNGCRNLADMKNIHLNHVLTRAVGVEGSLAADTLFVEVRPHDRFLVCSDGVHDVLTAERIASLAGRGPLGIARRRLSDAVEAAGAPDNFSFIIVRRRGGS